jgi:hypothetical protein
LKENFSNNSSRQEKNAGRVKIHIPALAVEK